ncbi:MAG TPA: bifunctional [glutamine synthetase] adenylyltransferase/[glutamine synthetase]-adenylyl-L-tyrosine phosphorylase [Micromonosporaceae bacterium]|jgi:glutamate-ammonia-ligase adenylyltransferase|nr:bifunctional [glutamine synthetase] adenylyltransferase/[glutamine synthetase]-adenylyl-L-tyrosine phosphorylase [Micromonosporaceae bacterium]
MTRPARTPASLARFGFSDAGRAAGLLDAVGLRDDSEVLGALGRCADPDLALRQLHRIAEAARVSGTAPDPAAAIRADHVMCERLIAVLGASGALGDHLAVYPGDVTALSIVEELGGGDLRRAYHRSLLRIVADDLTGERDIEATMAGLSWLADETLRVAYATAAAELDVAPRLAVIAMGKCGGNELNYVSDVDVIFVAAGDEDLAGGTALATRLMAICGQAAWPVDANLRPEGSHGPLVRTLASHLAYYRKWARTWEFQALLKARPAAGDADLAGEWLAALRPLVWHAAERPEAVDDVRAMRRRIIESVPVGERDREIKRGPGGLRDIEFAVQLLQLVHGRADESLRSPSTLEALRSLVDGGYVGRADGEALVAAYRFLRGVEHRLQLQRLRRTHTVPDEPRGLRWLAQALGYRTDARRDAVSAFRTDWVAHAGQVRRLHVKLLYRPLLEAVAKVPAESLRLTPDAARARLQALGFADPAGALRHIEALTGGVSRTAAIQRTLLPVLLEEFADAPEPDRGLLAYRKVSEKLGPTPWYLRLLRDSGPVAQRLARLLGLSRYVTNLLVRDPEALRLLADDAELVPRTRESLVEGFAAAAARHLDSGDGDPDAAIAAVRALRRRELFRIASADVLSGASGGLAPARPADVVAVGRALADVTDATLAAALRVARGLQYGTAGLEFAVIGMGRLGGYEMSYPSDADVLFVFDGGSEGSAHSIAEELRRLLAVPAPDPPLGVDADLRPEGRQGPLVRSLAAYAQYYQRWSRVWETQALLRARFICGDEALGVRFLALADRTRYPAGGLSREQVTEIRRVKARVDSERLPRGADPLTHAKLGRGGLSDVEWTVQLLQLRHAHAVPSLRTTRTLDALAAAREAGLVGRADTAALAAAWRLASRVRNALTLVRGRPGDQLPRHGVELAGVCAVLGAGEPGAFVDEYLRTARRARGAVDRLF